MANRDVLARGSYWAEGAGSTRWWGSGGGDRIQGCGRVRCGAGSSTQVLTAAGARRQGGGGAGVRAWWGAGCGGGGVRWRREGGEALGTGMYGARGVQGG